ncbi:DUF636 domain-containing protein [Panaeolus papilionaceus]|nr:DUF636 domain-containing protein [Panaeolus papilionaceus]
MTTPPQVYNASCLCKAVKFTLTGEPFHFVLCHCSNCKQTSGSGFLANAMFKPQQISITKGATDIVDYRDGNTLSGNIITRSFCGKCGANLFIKPAKGGIVITHPSVVEGKTQWVPKKEMHVPDKFAWIKEITLQQKKATSAAKL